MTSPVEILRIEPLAHAVDAAVSVPGSKSITNRALIMAALAEGVSTLTGALFSDDTRVMLDSLCRLGLRVEADEEHHRIQVEGTGGQIPSLGADLFVGNSGTSIRFLTGLVSLGEGVYRLDGVPRMRERPQAELLQALHQLGVDARSEAGNGRPPLVVHGTGAIDGGSARLSARASSQFVTALLMVAPYASQDVTLAVEAGFRPFYVDITVRMMEQWDVVVNGGTKEQANRRTGDKAERENRRTGEQASHSSHPSYTSHQPDAPHCPPAHAFHVTAGQRYQPQAEYAIEPDASSASYFFAAAALCGGRVTVPGLGRRSLQGDVRFATEVLPEMGCIVREEADGLTVEGPPDGRLRGVDRDMSAISDTSLTLAAIAPFASSPTTIRNIGHARQQECDRITAACTELRKLGVAVEEYPDGMKIYPAEQIRPADVDTYADHRVAMSFALIGLLQPGIAIRDPGCVAKTFPTYWQELERLR